MAKPIPLPSQEQLHKILRYEPDTGKLYWKSRPLEMFSGDSRVHRSWNTKYAGKEAFTCIRRGYRRGSIFGTTYSAHRVMFKLVHNAEPPAIDHISGSSLDNRIENLRAATPTINNRNTSLCSRNKSGAIGVCWDKESNKWKAQIKLSGRCVNLGRFTSRREAIAAREAANVEHDFHPNHGRPLRPESD